MFPAYSALKAIHVPSGEKCGFDVSPWKLVRRRAMPPARSTVQMLLAYANAIWVALTVGERSRRVCAPFAVTARGASSGSASRETARTVSRLRRIGIGCTSGKALAYPITPTRNRRVELVPFRHESIDAWPLLRWRCGASGSGHNRTGL